MDEETKKKTKGKQITSSPNPSLPSSQQSGEFTKLNPDLIFEIFSRLPLKTLSSCKNVCKSWLNLTLHPCLAHLHYTKSLSNKISPCILLYDRWKDFFLIDHQVFDEMSTKASLHHIKFPGNFIPKFEIIGSVNGLICFGPDSIGGEFVGLGYYVCNPITREYLSLPLSVRNDECPNLSGFGYDEGTNQYKIIRILQNYETVKAEAEVFTIGSEAWRVIVNVPYITDEMQTNVLVNGALHWISSDASDESDDVNTIMTVAVSFVVGLEEFCVVQLPDCVNNVENRGKEKYLAVLGDCLAFVMADSVVISKKKDIWVMKEYGVGKSWVKEYTVREELLVSAWDGGYALTRFRNGEFLFQYKRKTLVYYDPKSETIKLIVIQDKLWEGYYEQALIHMGSLFSPKSIGQLQ